MTPDVKPLVGPLFWIGMGLIVLKAGDWILRADQRKWVQDKTEALAKALQANRPLAYVHSLVSDGPLTLIGFMAVLALVAGIVVSNTFGVNPFASLGPTYLAREYGFHYVYAFLVALGGIIGQVLIPLAFGALAGPSITTLLFQGTSYPSLITRALLFATVGAIVLTASFYFVVLADYLGRWNFYVFSMSSLQPHWSTHWTNFLSSGGIVDILFGRLFLFVILYLVPLITVCLIVISALGLLAGHFVVRFAEGVAWRTAEYKHGAWSAILVLVTLTLGLLEFYLKSP